MSRIESESLKPFERRKAIYISLEYPRCICYSHQRKMVKRNWDFKLLNLKIKIIEKWEITMLTRLWPFIIIMPLGLDMRDYIDVK